MKQTVVRGFGKEKVFGVWSDEKRTQKESGLGLNLV